MRLDWQTCNRARLSRDARFDGKFFIAVLTSRVYCRSICPAPTAKDKNVRYYATAAAAAEAGFRPCLRCRPECSPQTAAWIGTPNTVSRALRLIEESGLEEGGVEGLADRLGVGSRHLRRLFLQHLGATPSAVAKIRRLQFAKKLIDETALPMSEVALASGFGCVRRFNASVLETYHRTPTEIRRLVKKSQSQAENQYVFRLRFRPPYHWQGMLSFLAARATPGVEIAEQGRYRRTISLNGRDGYFEVELDTADIHDRDALIVRVQFGDPRSLFLIVEKIRGLFDLNADWIDIAHILADDPILAAAIQSAPGVRVPGCWDGFELGVRAIVGQQITVKAATTFAGRIAQEFGRVYRSGFGLTHLFPAPSALAGANLADIGLTRFRAETVRQFAKAVEEGRIKFDGMIESEKFQAELREVPGVGPWTAQYIAMRALREPDAFPAADIALQRGAGIFTARELERRAEGWRPWRAYAAMYLWQMAAQKNTNETRQKRSLLEKVSPLILTEGRRTGGTLMTRGRGD